MRSTRPPWRTAAGTTVPPVNALTTRATTRRSCWIRMATTSKPCSTVRPFAVRPRCESRVDHCAALGSRPGPGRLPDEASTEHGFEFAAGDQPRQIVVPADQRALHEHHRERRPTGPHLQRIAPPPLRQVAAMLDVVE